jgi:hypothetical protein
VADITMEPEPVTWRLTMKLSGQDRVELSTSIHEACQNTRNWRSHPLLLQRLLKALDDAPGVGG